MKEGDKVRSKNTHFTGTVSRLQRRLVHNDTVVERVLIVAAHHPGTYMWCDVADVEIINDDVNKPTGVQNNV